MRITVVNRGPEAAPLHVLPTIWFRNTWSWSDGAAAAVAAQAAGDRRRCGRSTPSTDATARRWLYCDGAPELLFTENETNTRRLFGVDNAPPLRQGRHQRLRRPRRRTTR